MSSNSIIPNVNRKIGSYPSTNIGFAYIVLPTDVDRAQYIQQCYISNNVAIFDPITQTPFLNTLIDKDKIQSIIFPETEDDFGSPILYCKIPTSNSPVVFSVLKTNDENLELEENSFRVRRTHQDILIDMFLKANEGIIDIELSSVVDDPIAFNLRMKNANKTAEFNIDIEGTINIKNITDLNLLYSESINIALSDGKTQHSLLKIDKGQFYYQDAFKNKVLINEKGIQFIDAFNNQITTRDGEIQIIDKEGKLFKIDKNFNFIGKEDAKYFLTNKSSSEEESVALASIVIEKMDKILTALQNPGIYVSPAGPAPLSNAIEFQQIQQTLNEIKSNFVFIDKNN